MSGTRKDPLRIRKRSTKEFGRVLGLLRKIMEGNSSAIEELKARVDALEIATKKRKRGRPPKNKAVEK